MASATCYRAERWSWFPDQFFAALSYSIDFISGGNFQVRSQRVIGLSRCHQTMG